MWHHAPKRFLAGAIALLASTGMAIAQSDKPEKLVLAHGLAPLIPMSQIFEFIIAPRLERYSGGRFAVDLKPNNSLCSEHKCVEQAKLGQVDIVTASGSNMGNFGPTFDSTELPFLFKDDGIAQASLNGWFGDYLRARAAKELDLHVLGVVVSLGYRSMQNSVREVRRPRDVKGIKFRVSKSAVEHTLVREWGGIPVPYDWGQIYEGLQSGVVQGMYIPNGFVAARKLYEVTPFVTETGGMLVTHVVMMTRARYNGLPAWGREAIDRVSKDIASESLGIDRMVRAKLMAEIESKAKVSYPNASELREWYAAAPKAWLRMKGRYDPAIARRLLEEQGQTELLRILETEGAL